MRVFGKIAFVFFMILLVLSIGLNIMLGVSSTNNLIFKDDVSARITIMSNSLFELESSLESEGLSIKSTNQYPSNNGTATDRAYCKYESKLEKCTMVSVLYDDKGVAVKTSYFPGDGFKYTVEGETKTKSYYSNDQLNAYVTNLFYGWGNTLTMLQYDSGATIGDATVSYDTSMKFVFSKFSLLKTINCTFTRGESKVAYAFNVDNKDRVTSLSIDGKASLELSYSKNEITFPSFEDFN